MNEALQTGFLELSGDKTKTGELRYVPISDNLKAWLLVNRKESGPLLPPRWLEKTAKTSDREEADRLAVLAGVKISAAAGFRSRKRSPRFRE
ncbi:MAG TPA: hypothetical protein VFW05_10590 [Verrucomicrobiae bacterium]|nr:hypothetical protein [Verrucomicrobiae bacterium]